MSTAISTIPTASPVSPTTTDTHTTIPNTLTPPNPNPNSNPFTLLNTHAKSNPYTFSPTTTSAIVTAVQTGLTVCTTMASTLFCVCRGLCASLPEYESTVRAGMRYVIHRQLMALRFVHSSLGTQLEETLDKQVKIMGVGGEEVRKMEEGMMGWYREEVEGVMRGE